jgi:hypothetical protein
VLITKTRAAEILRRETGRSLGWCESEINGLRTTRDGCRDKVHQLDVNRLVRLANQLPEPEPAIKFSSKLIERIRRESV